MKTTIEIADSLYRRAKKHAADQGITFGEIAEAGLRIVLEHKQVKTPFQLRKASYAGDGLLPGVTWRRIRERSYSGSKVINPLLSS